MVRGVRLAFRARLIAAIATASALSIASGAGAFTAGSARAQSGSFLEVNGGGFTLDGQPWVLKGFNYFPRNYGWSAMTEWNWTEVDQELELASSVGANTIRVMVDYGYSTGHPEEVWSNHDVQAFQQPSATYIDAMQHLLSIADSHGLKVIFTLFNYVPTWAVIDYAEYDVGSTYLRGLVPAFANDPRVAAWSIYNEGDLIPEKFSTVSLDQVLHFYAAMAATIKALDTQHLITADFGRIWNAHTAQDLVDFISFHYYDDSSRLPQEIRTLRGRLNRPIPIVASEFGAPSAGNQFASLASQTVALGAYTDIALAGDAPLNGALVWLLVDQNPPQTLLSRQGDKGTLRFGLWDGNLQPKPAVAVVENYFSGGCGPGQRIELRFPNAPTEPQPNGQRDLQVGVWELALLGSDGSVISQVRFGTPEANVVEGRGWYQNESWGQWAGDPDRIASLCMVVPTEARAISIEAHAIQPDTELQLWYMGVVQGSVTLETTPSQYTLPLVASD